MGLSRRPHHLWPQSGSIWISGRSRETREARKLRLTPSRPTSTKTSGPGRMPSDAAQEFLIEITGRNRSLHLLPSPPSLPKAHRFQGGLIYSSGLELQGRVVSPQLHTGQLIRIWTYEFRTDSAEARSEPYLGSLEHRSVRSTDSEIIGSIYLPQGSLEAS